MTFEFCILNLNLICPSQPPISPLVPGESRGVYRAYHKQRRPDVGLQPHLPDEPRLIPKKCSLTWRTMFWICRQQRTLSCRPTPTTALLSFQSFLCLTVGQVSTNWEKKVNFFLYSTTTKYSVSRPVRPKVEQCDQSLILRKFWALI